ncbi:MAG: LPS export ABC transporter periplasmic protein LptC [Oligoflexia bacterium]|nr:LPS export ABC transporter periplasmic protein LptC [Oligoflexia bacterium]
MRKLKKWGLFFLFVLLGMEILTIAPKKLGKKEEVKHVSHDQDESSQNSNKGPSQVHTTAQLMRGVRLVEAGKAGKEWELEALTAQGYKEKGTWKMQGVTTKYYGEGDAFYKVTGDKGSIELETKNMEIFGNVLMETSEGFTIKTDMVKFNSKSRQLYTDRFVEVLGPKSEGKFELTAYGFNANLNNNIVDLKKDVKAVREVQKNKDMNIKSEIARIEGRHNLARFEKDVQVDLEGVRMTGAIADFEFDKKTKKLDSLLMQKDVRVTDQERFATSEKAKVIFSKNEYVLSGNPRVIQNNNELRGEEIHLLDGGKQVKVLRAKAKVENKEGTKP